MNVYFFLIVYLYRYFVLCVKMNDFSNPHEKFVSGPQCLQLLVFRCDMEDLWWSIACFKNGVRNGQCTPPQDWNFFWKVYLLKVDLSWAMYPPGLEIFLWQIWLDQFMPPWNEKVGFWWILGQGDIWVMGDLSWVMYPPPPHWKNFYGRFDLTNLCLLWKWIGWILGQGDILVLGCAGATTDGEWDCKIACMVDMSFLQHLKWTTYRKTFLPVTVTSRCVCCNLPIANSPIFLIWKKVYWINCSDNWEVLYYVAIQLISHVDRFKIRSRVPLRMNIFSSRPSTLSCLQQIGKQW